MLHQQLLKADQTPILAWLCGNCGTIYGAEDIAAKCCICIECGKQVGDDDFYRRRGYPIHKDCYHERDRKRTAERMASAEKLAAWDGWVYRDGCGSNEGYFINVGAFVEWWQDEYDEPVPEFVVVCKSSQAVPDGGRLMERLLDPILEAGWEDMEEHLSGVDELADALRKFSEANNGLLLWHPDYTRVVKTEPIR